MLIALGAMIGPAVGFHYHQTTIGFLIGVGVAVVVAVLIWLVNRASA